MYKLESLEKYSTNQQVIDSDDSWGIKCTPDGPEGTELHRAS